MRSLVEKLGILSIPPGIVLLVCALRRKAFEGCVSIFMVEPLFIYDGTQLYNLLPLAFIITLAMAVVLGVRALVRKGSWLPTFFLLSASMSSLVLRPCLEPFVCGDTIYHFPL